jgi:hypothetical protein
MKTLKEMATKHSVSEKTIQNHCRVCGLYPYPKTFSSEEEVMIDQVIAMISVKMPQERIRAAFGSTEKVSQSSLFNSEEIASSIADVIADELRPALIKAVLMKVLGDPAAVKSAVKQIMNDRSQQQDDFLTEWDVLEEETQVPALPPSGSNGGLTVEK